MSSRARRRSGLLAAGALATLIPGWRAGATPTAPDGVAVTSPARPLQAIAGGVEGRFRGFRVRVEALTPGVIRVRLARDGAPWPEDASWATPAAIRRARAAVVPTADGFDTAELQVHLDPATGALTLKDPAGRVVAADAPTPFLPVGAHGFQLRRALPLGEHVFALGDKTGELDRRGGTFVDWNTDSFGFKSSTDPIYKSVPFFISAGGGGGAYGVFLDNTWRVAFDFAHAEPEVVSLTAPDGPADYYLLAGPGVRDVVRRYTALTGRAPLLPRWAFGYQQSRYSYMSAAEVEGIAARLRAEHFPTDVIWLDIDFQDRNRPFTTNPVTFPNLSGLVKEMAGEGVRLVTIADLHIPQAPGQGYAPYDTGAAGDQFVHAADGRTYVGVVWPGPSVFPDFTRTATRDWWGGLYGGFVRDGVAGFWDDMNEPAIFATPTLTMPLDNVHRIASDDFAPRLASHAEVHNVYGMENSRATFEGVQRLRPALRPFVMTRATYAGGQRYATTWTGDNSSTFDHLRLGVHQILNLGLSGFGYSTADAGGFAGGPSPEVLTRWFEIGAFLPILRDHSAKDAPRAEPWIDGPGPLAIRRRFVEARYRLIPYIYAVAEAASRTGDPLMRPVFYDYPDSLSASCDASMSFTLGRDLLVAAPPQADSPRRYDVCLPAGGWYDFWTGRPVSGATGGGGAEPIQSASQAHTPEAVAAGLRIRETPQLDALPVFVRAGTILPRQPLVQSLSQTPAGPLQLDVYPGPDCRGELYDDDGVSLHYLHGGFHRREVTCDQGVDGRLSLHFHPAEGQWAPWWRSFDVRVHGWRPPGAHALADGRALQARVDPEAGEAAVQVAATVSELTLEPGDR